MIKKILLAFLGIWCLVTFSFVECFSQTQKQNDIIEVYGASNCEVVASFFDSFAQNTSSDKTIIIIAYKGEKESKEAIALRRLHNAKTYLTEYYKETSYSRSPDKVITAVETSISEKGKLEFYVDGKLSITMVFLDNRDLYLSPCYIDSNDYCSDKIKKLFFPCVEKVKSNKLKTN